MLDVLRLTVEKRRRDAIRVSLTALYEFVPGVQEARLKATEIYHSVGDKLNVSPGGPRFQVTVRATLGELGARPIYPRNRRWFIGLRPHNAPLRERVPRRILGPIELGKLRRHWYNRAREGDAFVDIEKPDGSLVKSVSARALEMPPSDSEDRGKASGVHSNDRGWWLTRAELNGAYFQKRKDAYWRLREALDVWALYVVEALPIREVETRTGLGRDKIHRTLKLFERWMSAGQPGLFKETSSDGEETLDDLGDLRRRG